MITSLSEALPRAEFVEHHFRIINAPPAAVWSALQETRWGDLRVTMPLMAIRSLGNLRELRGSLGRRTPRILEDGPVVFLHEEPGSYVAGGEIGRPWQISPEPGPGVGSLADLAAYEEPGWLKYGMDFTVHELAGGRTRLETTTLCEPTDLQARRRFARYWRLIRPFSGLIRHDLLRAVAVRAERR